MSILKEAGELEEKGIPSCIMHHSPKHRFRTPPYR